MIISRHGVNYRRTVTGRFTDGIIYSKLMGSEEKCPYTRRLWTVELWIAGMHGRTAESHHDGTISPAADSHTVDE